MSGLQHRVSMRDERPRFPQAKPQLAKQPLALAHTERHAVPPVSYTHLTLPTILRV